LQIRPQASSVISNKKVQLGFNEADKLESSLILTYSN
jgi:hypothetical protein